MAKDHFIPQFYLRNFQIPSQPGMIYSYMRKKRPKAVPISKAAQEEGYYDLKRDDPTADKKGLDKMLWMTENNTAPVINKLLASPPQKLSFNEYVHLTWFISLLAYRTPFAREQMASMQLALYNRDFKNMMADEEKYQEFIKDIPASDLHKAEIARKAFLEGDIYNTFERGGETEDYLMGQQLLMAKEIAQILQQRWLNIIEPSASEVFPTSDNPVICVPDFGNESPSAFGYANANLLLPLSPQRALYFTHRPLAPKIIPIAPSRMHELQFYIITQCNKFAYSHIISEEFQRILDMTEEGQVHQVTLPE